MGDQRLTSPKPVVTGLAHSIDHERDDFESSHGITYCRRCGSPIVIDRRPEWVAKPCRDVRITFRAAVTDRCPSTTHDDDPEPPTAVIPGIFDCSDVNGRDPERITYCLRCARGLGMVGMFTADDPDFDPSATSKSA